MCLYSDNYITIIGSSQLLAFAYFLARFTCFVKYYWTVDFIFMIAYLLRVLAYFNAHLKKRNLESRRIYWTVQAGSSVALAIGALSLVSMKWAEWQHFPTWPFINWFVFLAMVNGFNTFILRQYWLDSSKAESEALIYTDSEENRNHVY